MREWRNCTLRHLVWSPLSFLRYNHTFSGSSDCQQIASRPEEQHWMTRVVAEMRWCLGLLTWSQSTFGRQTQHHLPHCVFFFRAQCCKSTTACLRSSFRRSGPVSGPQARRLRRTSGLDEKVMHCAVKCFSRRTKSDRFSFNCVRVPERLHDRSCLRSITLDALAGPQVCSPPLLSCGVYVDVNGTVTSD